MVSFLLLAFAAAVAPKPLQRADFHWSGAIRSGKTIEIIGINGDIDAVGSSSGDVDVSATKKGRRSDPEDVEIKVIEHEDGVTICAVYPTPRGDRENECRPGGKGHMNTRDNDVSVHFTLRVPSGVRFVGRTVNGGIEAERLVADADAYTVNGSIRLETRGYGSATTVNGSINASLGRADWDDDLEFSTVNGSITLALPDNVSAQVRASTVNGDIETDFPLTVKGRWGPKRLNGTIGSGGRGLSFSTVNGDIEIKKGT